MALQFFGLAQRGTEQLVNLLVETLVVPGAVIILVSFLVGILTVPDTVLFLIGFENAGLEVVQQRTILRALFFVNG